ncbi:MAG: phosphoglycerate kinase [Bacteroidia bacterium]|nr:phosphoglycerate kinase [Bacteroidia bacterium]
MKTVNDFNFSGKKVLVRVDFNVPLDKEYKITDDKRIRAAIPTINKILNDGGSAVLMSHLGRPKEGPVEKYSLKHLVAHLSYLLGVKVGFSSNCIGEEAEEKSSGLKNGEVLLLENLRFHKEEEKGDEAFAEKLSKLGDIYVNDAFGTAHRAHASTTIVAKYFEGKKCFGLLMAAEIENADRVMRNAEKPFTAIMGGAKVSDKLLIIENLLARVNHLIIGGGMAFTFVKAKGGRIGKSLVEDDKLELASTILKSAKEKNVQIHLPIDAVIADAFLNDAKTAITAVDTIPDGWMGLDIGPESIKIFSSVISNSKTVLWNGPMGVFEMQNFAAGTKAIAHSVADATSHGAFSLIGGGDSAAAVAQLGFENRVSYVSTGGGALLEYFEGKELPGIKAVME